jgi:hypothetical protein
MALRILPFRQYSDHDVVNLYALGKCMTFSIALLATGGGDAGVFVTVSAGNFDNDPITYQKTLIWVTPAIRFLGLRRCIPKLT